MKKIYSILIMLVFTINVNAQFSGDYAPANWTFTSVSSYSDASVDISSAPSSITFNGNNSKAYDNIDGDQSDDYSTVIMTPGTISFSYVYNVDDYDTFLYVLNEVETLVATKDNPSGNVMDIQVVADDVFAFRIKSKDDAGGRGVAVISNFSAPQPAPTVKSVSSSTANGTYKTGEQITILVEFSDAVSVTGLPQLILETGDTDRVVDYVSGSGTAQLTFLYTVQAGDNSVDIDYVSTNSLALNGGTIQNASSKDAVLTLPVPGEASSLGANKDIVISIPEDASFSYDVASYCSDDEDPTPTITGATGGVFTSTTGLSINESTGVIDLTTSDPRVYTVTYTTSGVTGAANSSTFEITINALQEVSFTAPADLCVDAGIQTGLSGGSPNAGSFTEYVINAFDFTNSRIISGSFTFNASTQTYSNLNVAVTGGAYPNFVYSGDSSPGSTSSSLTLLGPGRFLELTFSNPLVEAGGTVNITGVTESTQRYLFGIGRLSGTAFGTLKIITGVYSGPGVTDGGDGTYSFDPAVAGAGTHTFTYTVTNNTGCSNSTTDTIEVFDLPAVIFTAPDDISVDAGVQENLSGGAPVVQNTTLWELNNITFEDGGTVSGRFEYDPATNRVIDWSLTVTGGNLPSFTYTTSNSYLFFPSNNILFVRIGTASDPIRDLGLGFENPFTNTTVSNPILPREAKEFLYSDSNNQRNITSGTATGNLNSVKGVYSGDGVTDNEDSKTYSFDPAIAGVGTHTITYTYTNANGCTAAASDAIEVFKLPLFEGSTPSSEITSTTSFTLNTDIDIAGTIYYVVVADGASAPTAAEVKSGTGNGGASVIASGNASVNTGAFSNDFSVTGLTPETAYDVYVVAQDDKSTPHLQENPTKVAVTTLKLTPDANNILYVNKTATGNKTGDSWVNAIPELADALVWGDNNKADFTTKPLQIWVAGGTYKPLYSARDGANFAEETKDNAFLMVNNVQLYGGFAGTESILAERDLSITANKTTLSGDIGAVNDDTDNANNVVVSFGAVGTARLDGFTVSSGRANDARTFSINNTDIRRFVGGGMFNRNSSPTIINTVFIGNTAKFAGGGMYNLNSSPTITNTTFIDNSIISTEGKGGGMFNNSSSSPTITNTTFSGNLAADGSGMANQDNSNAIVNNTIVTGTISNDNATPVYKNSIIADKSYDSDGSETATNLTVKALFNDPTNGDYSLFKYSPAVNAGNNALYTGTLATDKDLTGNSRLFAGLPDPDVIDIGAYEFQAEPVNPSDYFITTWKTDNEGKSNNTSITIPTTGTGYSYDIDWENDGVFDEFNLTGNSTHDYGTAGTYTVAISGSFPRIYFNNNNNDVDDTDDGNINTGEKEKIIAIEQWGTNSWVSMERAFYGCTNLVGNSTDKPDLSGVTDMSYMFAAASSFNQDISNWDVTNITNMLGTFGFAITFNQDISTWNVSNVTNMNVMFAGAEKFNKNIGNWNVSSVTDMLGMFGSATAFNQDISTWNVSNVTGMTVMFQDATAFDQDLGEWDVSNVTTMFNMFLNVTLSTANYDALLTGWSKKTLQENVNFNGGNSKYCSGTAARQKIITDFKWTITDGGSLAGDITDITDLSVQAQYTFPTIAGTNLTGTEAYYTETTGGGTKYAAGDIIKYTDATVYPITLYIYDANTPNCSDEESFNLTLTAPDQTGLAFEDNNFFYDGTTKSLAVTGQASDATVVYVNNDQTDAGTYTVKATVTRPNFATAILEATLTINKTTALVTADAIQTFTYDGSVKNVTASLNHTETALTYSPQQGYSNAGTYAIKVDAVATDNYLAASQNVSLVIEPATQVGLAFEDNNFFYDGITKSLAVTGQASDATVVYENNDQINIGTYTVKATVTRPNYAAQVLNATLTINKAAATITADAIQTFTYDGSVKNITASLNHTETALTFDSQQGYTNAGTYTVTVAASETTNYAATSKNVQLVINKASQAITFDALATRSLENDTDFQLVATSSSGLPVTYTSSFTSPQPAATVASSGFVELQTSGQIQIKALQAGNANYQAATAVERILNITSSNALASSITIDGQVFNNPAAQLYYLIDCDNGASIVDVAVITEANAQVSTGSNFSIAAPTPGIYRQAVVVTSQDGTQSKTYIIVVEKVFDFDAIIVQKYNNTLVVDNNPATNGGYSFVSYKWFKNGQLVTQQQAFSEGNNASDRLDPNATYQAVMITTEGDELRTCISKVQLSAKQGLSIIQNPVPQGAAIKAVAQFSEQELNNAMFHVYDLNGRLVVSTPANGVENNIQLPDNLPVGVYKLILITDQRSEFINFIRK
ncbi:BspA family leucine-rich repeat surface protein [Nonlabens antarcticus]|uniref:BspA family leucine-rich repeat surface protein n=1 Tax=Nonlabens antarcticus TaxID=392714 RepID=UPI00189123C6|nr:BspA family leucine-rich repeat surface protein [Nonlabens antarcticus]